MMEGAGSRSESASGRVGGERIRRVGKDGRRESPRGEERASPALLSYLVRYETSSVERTVARFSLCSCGPRPASRAVPAAIVSSRTPRAALLIGTRNFVTALLLVAISSVPRPSSLSRSYLELHTLRQLAASFRVIRFLRDRRLVTRRKSVRA